MKRITQRFVRTEYKGPTDHHGSRIVARNMSSKQRAIVPWDYELDAPENHERAARKLLGDDSIGASFAGTVLSASLDNGGGWVWTRLP